MGEREEEERAEGTGPQRRRNAREVRRKKIVEERKREGIVGVLIETRTKASGVKAKTAGETEMIGQRDES